MNDDPTGRIGDDLKQLANKISVPPPNPVRVEDAAIRHRRARNAGFALAVIVLSGILITGALLARTSTERPAELATGPNATTTAGSALAPATSVPNPDPVTTSVVPLASTTTAETVAPTEVSPPIATSSTEMDVEDLPPVIVKLNDLPDTTEVAVRSATVESDEALGTVTIRWQGGFERCFPVSSARFRKIDQFSYAVQIFTLEIAPDDVSCPDASAPRVVMITVPSEFAGLTPLYGD